MRVRIVCSTCLVLFGIQMQAQAPPRRPQQQAVAQEQPASLRGIVVNALTGEPIPRAEVNVNGWGKEPRAFGALTTAEGKFSVTGMPAGRYNVRVERPGFTAPEGAAREEQQLTLTPGENRDDFKLRLVPCGSISGRVLDSTGEPVEFVQVAVEGGRGTGLVRTDEEGRFRVGGLTAGRYRVKASPVVVPLPPEIRTDGTAEVHHAATYYPSSLASKSASRVQVNAGADTSGIEIRLISVPIVRVSGTIAGIPEGHRSVRVEVSSASGATTGSIVRPNGSFEIWRLARGKYTITGVSVSTAGEERRTPRVDIEVDSADVEGLVLTLVPLINVMGRIEEDGSAPAGQRFPQAGAAQAPPQDLTLTLAGNPNRLAGRASIGADKMFTLTGIPPDRYRANLMLPRGYVKSIKIGSVETAGSVLDLRQASGDAEVTITIGYETGEVAGTVRSDGELGPMVVIVMPESDDFRPLRTMSVDRDGSFVLRSLPPGKYRLLAIDPNEMNGPYRTPDMQEYEDFLETVELRAGEKTTKDLRKYTPEEK